jgi:hypothetical protein
MQKEERRLHVCVFVSHRPEQHSFEAVQPLPAILQEVLMDLQSLFSHTVLQHCAPDVQAFPSDTQTAA